MVCLYAVAPPTYILTPNVFSILCDIILYYSISIIISHYTVYGDESSSKTRNSSDIYTSGNRD